MSSELIGHRDVFVCKNVYFPKCDSAVASPSRSAVLTVLEGELEMSVKASCEQLVCRAVPHDVLILREVGETRLRAAGHTDARCELYEFPAVGTCCGIFSLEPTRENTCLRAPRSDSFFDCIAALKAEGERSQACRADVIRGLTLCALSSLVRALGITDAELSASYTLGIHERQSGEHAAEMAEVLRFIDDSLSSDIAVEELVACAHMSRSQLYKVFRRHTGMTINEYILHRRVEKTVRLLSDTDCSVIEAAYDSGFTSSSGFYKTFKRIVGCSPKEYMRKLRDAVPSENHI